MQMSLTKSISRKRKRCSCTIEIENSFKGITKHETEVRDKKQD